MREKRNVKKVMMTTALITVGIVMIGGNASKAALQANLTTHNGWNDWDDGKTHNGAYYIEEIRKMETAGNTMGLNEELNTDLTSKVSNNIDVHMIRSTEYGAMAILSASGFGNPQKLFEGSIKSTTGNTTGVYIKGDDEVVAATISANTIGKNSRYYDLYTTDRTSAKAGDALGNASSPNPGCAKWHKEDQDDWFSSVRMSLHRGNYGNIFSYNAETYEWSQSQWNLWGRGVAVVGEGM